ncbi:mid1-interacting protein 1 isoform 1 [Tropilaelaps mercedesae]|uniref:Mid1-interacting protein 1 isoform 1 n=1 Tax=Tropilaelaps mercedesae TaxID=418985 RepID=A0A1V9X506_9ACAR|nr:mid1-interacting protein 1 isoform 1 [Tropilaelaps mercedesae]
MYQRSLEVASPRPSSRRPSRCDSAVASEIRCSQQSILTSMDRFVKSVANMDSTVLVPSRLRDLDATAGKVTPPAAVRSGDLHSLFSMLHDVKKELLWGSPGRSPEQSPDLNLLGGRDTASYKGQHDSQQFSHGASLRVPSVNSLQGLHRRHLSTGSVASGISDADTDVESLCDFVEGDYGTQLASTFRLHLHGLQSILQQLAESADYLSERYLEDIEPVV